MAFNQQLADALPSWFDGYKSNQYFMDGDAITGNGDLLYMQVAYDEVCLLYTSPSPRDGLLSRMPSSA